MAFERIVSGGRTGAERAALDWAVSHDIMHGGWRFVRDRDQNCAPDPKYNLFGAGTSRPVSAVRMNIKICDAAVLLTLTPKLKGHALSAAGVAGTLGKPWLHVHARTDPAELPAFLRRIQPKTVYFSGSDEEQEPGIYERAAEILEDICALYAPPPSPSRSCFYLFERS